MKPSRLSLLFILFTILIDSIGFGLIMPVMPDLLRDVTGGDLASAAIWGGILATSFAVMQFLCGPAVGGLSDRFGRRPVLLISLAVMTVDYLVMGLTGTIWLLFAGRIIGGITAATQTTATAYIADISAPEDKAANFGLVGAAFGIGFVIGPLIGGVLGEFGPRTPFYAAALMAALNMVFGYLVLPETVTDKIRRPFEWHRANPLGAFAQLGKVAGVKLLLVLFFVEELAFMVFPTVWAYFTRARFDWDPAMVGVSLAVFGLSIAITQGVLMRPVIRLLGEVRTVFVALTFNVFAFLSFAFVTSGTLALIIAPVTAVGVIATPALQAILSRQLSDDQQGELQGVISSARAVAMILSPVVMTQVFSAFTAEDSAIYLPGAPFLLSAGLMVLGIFIFAAYLTRRPTPA